MGDNMYRKTITLSDEEEAQYFSTIAKGKRAKQLLNKGGVAEDKKKALYNLIEQAEDAKNKIFCANLKLIDNVQYNYCYNPLYWLEDVKQDAAIKLMSCITSYEPGKGSFRAYASKCIKGCILDTLATNTNLIIQEKSFVKQVWKVDRFISDWHKTHGIDPTEQEIIENLPIKKQALYNVYNYNKQVYSYNTGVNPEDGSPASIEDPANKDVQGTEYALRYEDQQLVNTTETLEEGTVLHKQVRKQLLKILDEYCTDQERMILDYRFGFFAEPMAAMEIAELLNMDENEVELIWARALFKLEEPCRKKGLNLIL